MKSTTRPRTASHISRVRSPTKHQVTLSAYINTDQNRITDEHSSDGFDPRRAKPIRQIAADVGASITTVRQILKAQHYTTWRRCWLSFDALCEDAGIDLEAASRRAQHTCVAAFQSSILNQMGLPTDRRRGE